MATAEKAVTYEVMVDTWGGGERQYTRGELIRDGADCPYDLESALARGVVRVADVINGQPISSLGVPTLADGSPDWALQDATRYGAGLPDARSQRVLLEAELAGLDSRKDVLKAEIDRLRDVEDRQVEQRKQFDTSFRAMAPSPENKTQVGSPQQPGVSMPAIPGGLAATHPEVQAEHQERMEAQRKQAEKQSDRAKKE